MSRNYLCTEIGALLYVPLITCLYLDVRIITFVYIYLICRFHDEWHLTCMFSVEPYMLNINFLLARRRTSSISNFTRLFQFFSNCRYLLRLLFFHMIKHVIVLSFRCLFKLKYTFPEHFGIFLKVSESSRNFTTLLQMALFGTCQWIERVLSLYWLLCSTYVFSRGMSCHRWNFLLARLKTSISNFTHHGTSKWTDGQLCIKTLRNFFC